MTPHYLDGHQNTVGIQNITFTNLSWRPNPNWRLQTCTNLNVEQSDKLFALQVSEKEFLFNFSIGVKALN